MKIKQKRAAATMEYMALIMFIIGTLVAFTPYIIRGFAGRWRTTGSVFGHGAQYDPRDFGTWGGGGGTLECFYDRTEDDWVVTRCYLDNCDCTLPPEDPDYPSLCLDCRFCCSAGCDGSCPALLCNTQNTACGVGGSHCAWDDLQREWICTP